MHSNHKAGNSSMAIHKPVNTTQLYTHQCEIALDRNLNVLPVKFIPRCSCTPRSPSQFALNQAQMSELDEFRQENMRGH